ncbi:transketolase [Denitrobaculum tricleocarpae]|uniref:Pyruvate dehydrogenase E1 component n=2 Tax=Denitrobaculum tricleocarpae TaxID=2591009 RepID=A0A545TMI7_9PROT|nr:transketolase [Denitrobaculum tricleocarpae]
MLRRQPVAQEASETSLEGLDDAGRLSLLRALEKKILWLATWTVHNANHLRENKDGLKVGGHQASCASLVTIMTALYMDVLRPEDRVAVKPHASPVFHAIQYLLGKQTREKLEAFRAFGGAQSYPSRTKDSDDVDISTGSVGLGVAMTSFASLVQDYVQLRKMTSRGAETGRMIALAGDAELDEGNIYEALLEGWKHDIRNVWWIIDYNRQSLDAVVQDRLFGRIDSLFETMGWRVVTLKYGKLLEAAFREPGGKHLRAWIDSCPNSLYSTLVFKGGTAWRAQLEADIGEKPGIGNLLARRDDAALARLMTNLAGHDLEAVLEAFHAIEDDRPTCFIAYTIKGFGLPLAGHKDNHAGLMTLEQMETFRSANDIPPGAEWDPSAGLPLPPETLESFLNAVPFAEPSHRRTTAAPIAIPDNLPHPTGGEMSTQEGFGKIMAELARAGGALADHIVTTSPDVTVSTNLGGWVNRRGIFDRHDKADTFKDHKVASMQRWGMSPQGQHIELGIAENNLFLLLGALGLSHSLFGTRLLPIGTLYDPFIQRGLDALNYACYQDARFIVVATPSGLTLAPEGGAHQSISTPLIGMAQDGLAAFEPAFVDELAAILAWSFDYLQRDGGHAPRGEAPGDRNADVDWLRDAEGGAVYLRLSTRSLSQPERDLDPALRRDIIRGGYWLHPPAVGASLAILCSGAITPEAIEAHQSLLEEMPGVGLMVITSADRMNAEWSAAERARQQGHSTASSHVERLLAPLAPNASLVSVTDGHPASLAWLGSVRGQRQHALGVEHFGQSGSLQDLYRHYRIGSDAILDACAAACLQRVMTSGVET